MKQFLAAGRSPFFQMQLPRHSQASARDGFSFTWGIKALKHESEPVHWSKLNYKIFLLSILAHSFREMILSIFPVLRYYIQYLPFKILICRPLYRWLPLLCTHIRSSNHMSTRKRKLHKNEFLLLNVTWYPQRWNLQLK